MEAVGKPTPARGSFFPEEIVQLIQMKELEFTRKLRSLNSTLTAPPWTLAFLVTTPFQDFYIAKFCSLSSCPYCNHTCP